jgi:iron-sulfur cluster assembly protein
MTELTDMKEITQEIFLTDEAIEEIANIKKEQNIGDDFYLRIGVQGGGCSGFGYALAFDDQISDTDTVYQFGLLKVVVDYKSILYLKGVTMDYYNGPNGKGFTFDNPNASRTCGCGSSCG